MGYYVISLVINPLIKAALVGIAGTITACFLQMFYVALLFPFVMARLGNDSKNDVAEERRPKHARPNGTLPSSARS